MGVTMEMLVLSVRCILLLYLIQGIQAGESLCSEQHFCSCPPFMRHHSTSGDPRLYWGKPNYGDQYAIVDKSKELHCCVLPGYASLEWTEDDIVITLRLEINSAE